MVWGSNANSAMNEEVTEKKSYFFQDNYKSIVMSTLKK